MKQLTTYNRAAAYLNTIFDLLNARYFEGALSRPIITIQSTPKAYGHYTLYDAWSVDGDKGMREINIGAGTLSRPIENVVATLLHEMVHYWNDTNGIKDASRGNTYHNKNFKVNGGKVTYTAYVNEEKVYPRLNYIGNNKTDKFQIATIAFHMEAMPSYAKGEAGEDNSFLLTFAGKGTTSTSLAKGCRLPKTFGGNCAGTQGCGCAAYTHKSPTRRARATGPTDMVDDVAATWGTWKAKFVKSISRKSMVVTIY